MKFAEVVKVYKQLESTTKRLELTSVVENFLKQVDTKYLPKVLLLLSGEIFPKYTGKEIGVASQLLIRAISISTGFSEEKINELFKKTGDLGMATEEAVKARKQYLLLTRELTLDKLFENLEKCAELTGPRTVDRKIGLVAELLSNASAEEAKYVVRLILGELRVGVAEGIIRDAIARAFLVKDPSNREELEKAIEAVDYAWNVTSDFGEVAKIAKEQGIQGLLKVKPILGKPIQLMLGEKAPNIEEVVREFGKVAAEWKYDGARAQCHKKGDRIWIFTRRLEDVTTQFPEVVEMCRRCLIPNECIVEGEILAIDPRTQSPLPFQVLSQRIHRKYEIDKMVREIPIQVNLFDVVYVDGKVLFNIPFLERRKILEKIVKVEEGKFQLAKQIITDDLKELEEFYQEALNAKQEGIFLKVLNSTYMFGRRVGGWYKIKPIMETLDLVIVGASWGTGKRAGWLGSFVLACRDEVTGKFLECGMLGTGIKEKKEEITDVTFEELTNLLKPHIVAEKGTEVRIAPKLVIEVAYQEIQRSPHYASGFALRFPRLVRIRFDKSPEECDTLERVKALYEMQKK
ncbi:MAG: ATP-dependent DNA ligase [Candidatus Nanoarchaeia archaeon]|nr:ATP-dependent DNA ligase [Candidatus Haiyanarchaeum thermophilum]MCW1302952.1 ATP-dependent DNA ligase [Candidatus Haiyanarchaeum thermophilum]MCW1303630.1 ATP-dependent DNA ligase [Candidatus Haiyanarchaeum thermophilum]MCW1306311.1 ATP-dependent DNA ligase [Candidatus Haiyanarchaeum thermophilum]MCW1307179.1 ATP-dependent DNA ligase [Candidatus Haiyanarchaeum thermophilum]